MHLSLGRTALAGIVLVAAAGAAAAVAGSAASSGSGGVDASDVPASAGPLVFSDAFDGSRVDPSKWNTYITDAAASGLPWNSNGHGGSAASNRENFDNLEYDLPSQLHVGQGLRIVARRSPTQGVLGPAPLTYQWRSGVVSSYGKFEFEGGWLQVEAKMPSGQGMWPGIFMLPGPSTAGQPDKYEIDLFEGGYRGSGPAADNDAWHLHGPKGDFGGVTDVGTNLSDGVHTYALDWIPGKRITWYLDGRQVGEVTSAQAPIPREPMELIIDLQVAAPTAGSFHTLTGPSTPSSATLVVKGVQVYSHR